MRRRFSRVQAAALDEHVLDAWIDEAMAVARRAGLLDDAAYACALARSLLARGCSLRVIDARLRVRGVMEPERREALRTLQEASDLARATETSGATPRDVDLAAARAWLARKRLGPFARVPPTAGDGTRQKVLRALARAGFSYDVARRALAEPPEIT